MSRCSATPDFGTPLHAALTAPLHTALELPLLRSEPLRGSVMRLQASVALFAAVVAAGIASLILVAPVHLWAADRKPVERGGPAKYAELQSEFNESDELAALEAIGIALTEVGDGSTFVWQRGNGRINGVVKPTASFRDTTGRICRHLELVLAARGRTAKIEGVACRLGDGRWELDG